MIKGRGFLFLKNMKMEVKNYFPEDDETEEDWGNEEEEEEIEE
jgi:hypothetical protein